MSTVAGLSAGTIARGAASVLFGLLVTSVFWLIQLRVEARQLTAERNALLLEAQKLEDTYRSLNLEYYTFADYEKIREQAVRRLGMVEPSLEDGTLVYLTRRGQ